MREEQMSAGMPGRRPDAVRVARDPDNNNSNNRPPA